MANKNKSSDGKKSTPKAQEAAVRVAAPYQPKMSNAVARSTVKSNLGERVKLADYRSTITPLSPKDRLLLIDEATKILEQVYAHLPLKRALHANDPIQSLRLLGLHQASLDERSFQSALMDVFLGLRDLHTNYILPTSYARKFAFLPFRVEEFYQPGGLETKYSPDDQTRKYVVSWVSPVNTVASLKEGVVVTHWNGSPIELAVARNGDREAGSNQDARRAQGIEALTLRWLGMSLPPDEDWVDLTYTDGTKTCEARFDWEIVDAQDRAELLAGLQGAKLETRLKLGLDLKRTLLDRFRKLAFDPQAVQVERETKEYRQQKAAVAAPPPPREQTSLFPDVFPWFGVVSNESGEEFGYIRLKTFAPESGDVMGVVREFARILSTLPQTGLILDVRGNGGGYIEIGELILQMLTPRTITPEPFHFLATPLTLAMATAKPNGLDEWSKSIEQGLESGASFSQGFPLTDPGECNSIGQIYQGPVVLVTDALCYSTTDIFSAGFQDHGIGTVLGCHASTGAGGANVWEYADLRGLKLTPSNPFSKLPAGADMRVAARRCTRVGTRSGLPVEDYGVVSDKRYYLTGNDVVDHNVELIAAAIRLLKECSRYAIKVTPVAPAPRQQFTVEGSGIDRFDLWLAGRPAISEDFSGAPATVALPGPAAPGVILTANGYFRGNLVVSTRVRV